MQITEMKAKLNTVEEVKTFVAYLNQFPNDVDVSTSQYVVDGKSILGVYSLSLALPLTVKFHGEVSPELMDKLNQFKVTD
ncbi:MAG: HPr family phosphocarrier protein [Coprococcus sp.]